MKFLFDLFPVQHRNLIDLAFKDWEVVAHSERCFEITGRQWVHHDIVKLWQAIGRPGHVFVFDLQNGQEYYRQKRTLLDRKREIAPDDVLDAQTLQLIEQFRENEPLLEVPAQE